MNSPLTELGRIYLVGLRGSGKSTVGRNLAQKLGWICSDADDELEFAAGCSIADLFEAVGLEGFRIRESELLRDLAQRDDAVIATGGGCVVREENRDLLRTTGVTVWLTAKPETLWKRVKSDRQSASRRPALTALSARKEIDRLAHERERWYRDVAVLTIPTDDRSPEQVADAILRAWPSS
jgi:shikimate kinase